jgi:hypothetical protein
MRGVTIDVSVNLVTETCCVSTCGILFAVPEDWQRQRRRDHTNFYCPNGHHQAYQAKTKEEQLRDELAKAKQALDYQRQRGDRLEDDKTHLKHQVRAQKGVATRLRNKAIAGICAFCEHEFANVAEHVRAEHPSESLEEDPE